MSTPYYTYKVKAPIIVDGIQGTVWIDLGFATAQADGSIRMRLYALPNPHVAWNADIVLFLKDEES